MRRVFELGLAIGSRPCRAQHIDVAVGRGAPTVRRIYDDYLGGKGIKRSPPISPRKAAEIALRPKGTDDPLTSAEIKDLVCQLKGIIAILANPDREDRKASTAN